MWAHQFRESLRAGDRQAPISRTVLRSSTKLRRRDDGEEKEKEEGKKKGTSGPTYESGCARAFRHLDGQVAA